MFRGDIAFKIELHFFANEKFKFDPETDTKNYCKIATSKQKKTMELVHNSA